MNHQKVKGGTYPPSTNGPGSHEGPRPWNAGGRGLNTLTSNRAGGRAGSASPSASISLRRPDTGVVGTGDSARSPLCDER